MSLRTAATATIRPPSLAKPPKPPPFLRFIFQPTPTAHNCCLLPITQDILSNPSHPNYIKTQRRLDAFDNTKLHWSVGVNLDVAKKRVVRSWVARRVKEAVKEELNARGWGQDGRLLMARKPELGARPIQPLRGALKIFMAKERMQDVITASGEEVREEARGIVGEVVRRQVPVGEGKGRQVKERSMKKGATSKRPVGKKMAQRETAGSKGMDEDAG